eukprot:427166_1
MYNTKLLCELLKFARETQRHSVNFTNERIREFISTAVRFNYVSKLCFAIDQAFDGWKGLVGICVSECLIQSKCPDYYESVLFEILTAVLRKMATSTNPVWQRVAESLSSVATLVMAKLRDNACSGYNISVVECRNVLELTLAALARCKRGSARANLYTVLTNYVQYSRLRCEVVQNSLKLDDSGVMDIPSDQRALQAANSEILRLNDQALLSALQIDCVHGSIRLEAMALKFMECLLALDEHNFWLSRFGPLIERVCDQIPSFDAWLRGVVTADDLDKTQPILRFESVMSFLTKVGQTKLGVSRHMSGLLKALSRCRFIDNIPSDSIAQAHSMFRQSRDQSAIVAKRHSTQSAIYMQRYYRLVAPILRMYVAMTSTLSENTQFIRDTMDFLDQHSDVTTFLLQDKQANGMTLPSLEALRLTTALFYRVSSSGASLNRNIVGLSVVDAIDFNERLSRYHKLLALLFVKFATFSQECAVMKPDNMSQPKPDNPLPTVRPPTEQDRMRLAVLEVSRNLSGVFRTLCVPDSQSFVRSQSTNQNLTAFSADLETAFKSGEATSPRLGSVLSSVKSALGGVRFGLSERARCVDTLKGADSISANALHALQVCASEDGGVMRAAWKRRLVIRIESLALEISMFLVTLENCMLILYCYTKHFLRNSSRSLSSTELQRFQQSCRSEIYPVLDALRTVRSESGARQTTYSFP